MSKRIKEFAVMTFAVTLIAAGIYFFKIPNNFSTGGVSGISVIFGALFHGISAGGFIFIINMLLLVAGFAVIGRDFGAKTVYCSMLMSCMVVLFEKIFPMSAPLTSQPMLELVFAIILPAAGSALLFNCGASTGGTDIVAMIIKKYLRINISKALFISDFLIVMLTAFVFGTETWLYSMLGFSAKVFLMNNILSDMNMSKYCTVITQPEHEEKIKGFITNTLKKSATVSDSYTGAYMHDKKSVLLVALSPRQARLLKDYVKSVDDKSFIIINNVGDVSGKGFREEV